MKINNWEKKFDAIESEILGELTRLKNLFSNLLDEKKKLKNKFGSYGKKQNEKKRPI